MDAIHGNNAIPIAQNKSDHSLVDNSDSAHPNLSGQDQNHEDEGCSAVCPESKLVTDSADFDAEEQRLSNDSNAPTNLM